MKLLNKLIPIFSLASIAAIVTPLATSCAQTSNSITYKYEFERKTPESEPTVPFNTYITQYEPAEQLFDEGIDKDTAWQLYFDKLEQDPSVFADDYLYGASQVWKEREDWGKLISLDGSLKVTLDSFDRETKRFSWTIEICTTSVYLGSNNNKVDDFVSEQIAFKNIPCELSTTSSGGSEYWHLSPKDEGGYLSSDDEYSIQIFLEANTMGSLVKSESYIDKTNWDVGHKFYYIDDNNGLDIVGTSGIIFYGNFALNYKPLHYLMNNKVKE